MNAKTMNNMIVRAQNAQAVPHPHRRAYWALQIDQGRYMKDFVGGTLAFSSKADAAAYANKFKAA